MNITIMSAGTRGDIQPFVALGVGLSAAGHHVTVAVDNHFHTLVADHGLRHVPINADYMALAQTEAGKDALRGKGIFKLLQMIKPMIQQMLDDTWEAAQSADAIIYHPKALGGYSAAEKLGIPAFFALPLPFATRTAAFAHPLLPWANLGAALNRASYPLVYNGSFASVRSILNQWRRERLGLGKIDNDLLLRGKPVTKLYAYSEHVVPRPSDWDASSIVTGYWTLPAQEYEPPQALRSFLESGPKPIYVGFGSMTAADAEQLTSAVIGALQNTGQRGLIATGNGALASGAFGDDMFVLDSAPHEWLFPQMAAVIHHGGAGTAGAAFRAGVPQIICPFFGDQPFWGRRVVVLQVGPQPIPRKRISVQTLTNAIQAVVREPAMHEHATKLGEKIRGEHGVECAVNLISTSS